LRVVAALDGSIRPLPFLVLSVVLLATGVLGRDQWLTREVVRREARMMVELPTVAELLALAVAAGEGAVGALERVTRQSSGELAKELGRALADARAGASLVQALDGLSTRTGLPALARFVDGVAVAVERGTPLADVLRAQVELARMAEELVRMDAMRSSAATRLNAIVDNPVDRTVPPPMEPRWEGELPPTDSLLALALARRPMLLAGAATVSAAGAGERLAGREIWPDLEVGLQYGWRPMDDGTEHMVSVMLGLRLPIWAGSRQGSMRREATAMREMATADLQAMEAETRGRVSELVAAVARARRLRTLYRRTVLPQAEATFSSALAAYRVGGVDFMTLLDAQMNVNRYHQAAIAATAELGQAIAELEMMTATPLLTEHDAAGAVPGGAR